MKIKISIAAFVLLGLSSNITAASATERESRVIEEIIVTAQKRAESLQEVPVAVNAFTETAIQDAGIRNLADLAVMTPSLSVTSNLNPFSTRLTIRGIGTSQNDPALEPSVGLFVDGVFMARTGLGAADLTDIERIEVLQGPQGTLYGKNTNAGAISITTKRPNLERYEGYVEAGAGNFGMTDLTAAITGPLADNLAFRLSGNVHQRDGYYDNSGTGVDDQDEVDDWNLQTKLLWQPSEQLSFLLSAVHIERDTTCCGADATQSPAMQAVLASQGFAPDGNDPYDYDVATNFQDEFSQETDLVSLRIEYDLAWASITSITAWDDYDYTTSTDPDRSQLDILSIVYESYEGDSFSQELRLDGSFDERVDYQVGLYYFDQSTKRGDRSPSVFIGTDFITVADLTLLPILQAAGAPFPSTGFIAQPGDFAAYQNSWENETLAVFGQATWHVGERWHLTGGLRWTDEEREAELFSETISTAPLVLAATAQAIMAGVPPEQARIIGMNAAFLSGAATPINTTLDRSSDNVDWLAKLAYDISDNSMIYASASTGHKSGNFNGVGGPPDQREFDDEETISYELGLKSSLLDSTLRLNIAAFYSEIEEYQFQAQNPVIGTFVSNDGEVEVSGVDLQLEAVPLEYLSLTAGLLYMSKYEITDGPRKGEDLAYTADWSGNLGANLAFPLANGSLYLRADYIFMDDHLTNLATNAVPARDIDDRELLNARIGWRDDNWDISIWGKNLTDDDYATFTPNTNPIGFTSAYFLAPPRTYGATLRFGF
ncbi:MAG: TonB-dependent receptor [Pseudomonadales bacterium]|jgi:iron complex outermembrane receptor protein|nr:TonB-dependent receptor [Pseudomonadales bacterium]|tara:strand:+ start:1852 stop:4170 length:2319 start_codon:yes stop_codon:yes gene_type:complete